MWKVGPALSSALLVIVWGVFALGLVEGSEGRAAEQLGYRGPTVRIIAIPDSEGDDGARRSLTGALSTFVAERDLSVAFSHSYGTGLVTVLDEDGRFRNAEGSLAAALGPAGSGRAVLSTAVGGSGSGIPEFELPGGVTPVGTFEPEVLFEERYPVALFSVGARPFAEGVYLFAGDGFAGGSELVEELVRVFEANGMIVYHFVARDAVSPANLLAENTGEPYGYIVLLFTGITALAQVLVLAIYSAIFRDRLVVAAVLGAGRRHLRGMVWGRLLRQVLPGAAAGAGISVGVVLGTGGLALAETGTRVLVVAAALAVSILVSALICGAVAWREARRVARVVPC